MPGPLLSFPLMHIQLLESRATDAQVHHATMARRGECLPATDAVPPAAIAESCLSRLRLLRCPASLPYLAALAAAPTAIASLPPGVPVRLLVIDNVAAHFYRDRAASARAIAEAAALPRRLCGALPLPAVHRAAAAMLNCLARRFQLAVMATKTVMPASGYGGGGKDILPGGWTQLVTHRIGLSAPEAARGGGGLGGGGPAWMAAAVRAGHLFRAKWERWPVGADGARAGGGVEQPVPFMIGDGGAIAPSSR